METELDFEKRYRLAREIIETVVLTVLMFLIIRLAVQNFNIDGMSMEPSLHDQELILVDKWSYLFHAPARGDVIVFIAPPQPTQDYIKRIIGVPGDVITVKENAVTVNGTQLEEVYVDPAHQGNPSAAIVDRVIPPDTYFVLGDNRAGSSDSREWGCVPKKNIVGRAALIYWPLGQDNNGLLPNHGSVFNEVPVAPKLAAKNMCPVISNTPAPSEKTTLYDSELFLTNTLTALAVPAILARKRRKRV